jgi:L-alanine-DL-glutamate epimerase-like enolase superfamily enzyme
VQAAVEHGFTTFCLKVGGGWGSNFAKDCDNVKETRAAIRDNEDIHFCIDSNGSLDHTTALEYARRSEKYNLYKIEQPYRHKRNGWLPMNGMANWPMPTCSHYSIMVPLIPQ